MKANAKIEELFDKYYDPLKRKLFTALTMQGNRAGGDLEVINANRIVGAAIMLENEPAMRGEQREHFERWLRAEKMQGSHPAEKPVLMSVVDAVKGLYAVLREKGVDELTRSKIATEVFEQTGRTSGMIGL